MKCLETSEYKKNKKKKKIKKSQYLGITISQNDRTKEKNVKPTVR
jgi:hypothetical protein